MSGNATEATAAPPEAAAPPPPPPGPAPASPGAELVLAGHDVPARLADQLALAEATYRSNLVPAACRSVAGMMAAQRAAVALNVPVWTVMQNMYSIDGKVGYDAAFVRALVIRAGHKFRIIERTSERCLVRIIRHDDPEPFFSEFTYQDAVDADLLVLDPATGLPKKAQWKNYLKAMLVARATTLAVREACPEVLFGNGYTPDELGAVTDDDGTPVVFTSERADQPEPATAQRVQASSGDAERLKAQWRENIEGAPDQPAVDDLYQQASKMGILERPLYEDGTTVEAALAMRAGELRVRAAGGGDGEVHDAVVVDEETRTPTGVGGPGPRSNEPAPEVGEPAPEPEPAGPEPDDPGLCRDSASRRGVLTHLATLGDVDEQCRAAFGLEAAQVATRRLRTLITARGKQ